jgi:hypothetical protein
LVAEVISKAVTKTTFQPVVKVLFVKRSFTCSFG